MVVADELGKTVVIQRGAINLGRLHRISALPSGSCPFSLPAHLRLERFEIDFDALFGRDLLGQVYGEAVCVVKLECRGAGESRGALVQFGVQQLMARLEGSAELLLFPGHDVEDEVLSLPKIWIGLAHDIDCGADKLWKDQVGAAVLPGMTHSPPQDTAEDITAAIVGWDHTVTDQESDCPSVVGEDAEGDVGAFVGPVLEARIALGGAKHLSSGVYVEDGRDVLHDRCNPIETHPGVDVLGGEIPNDVVGLILDVLHEHQVPDLDVPVLVAADRPAFTAEFRPFVIEDL